MIFPPPQIFFNHPSLKKNPLPHNEHNHNDYNDLTNQPTISPPNIPRRYFRHNNHPLYPNEYDMSLTFICHSHLYDKLSTSYLNFVMQITNIYEPTNYHQVV